jgi:hypothetical protein
MPTSITAAPRGDPVAAHHLRPAHRGDQHVGPPALGPEVPRAGMRHGHGAIRVEQQLQHRPPDDLAPAEHHRPRAGQRHARLPQQVHDPLRRAGHQGALTGGEQPGVDGVEAVHVLVRADGVHHRLLPNMRREGELHEDAVHRRVFVQFPNQVQQRGLRRVRRQTQGGAVEAGRERGAVLVADVNAARRVVSDAHHPQPRPEGQRGDPGGDAAAQPPGHGLAVYDAGGHRALRNTGRTGSCTAATR